jgi:hypothetical protein
MDPRLPRLYYTEGFVLQSSVKIVQARLDADTEKTLARLVDQLGVSPSMVVREGIRVLAASQPKTRKIAGLGKFSSGIPDLGSSKKHLRGFGR